MQLLDYMKTLTPQEREKFASDCQTTVNYLWKLARRFRFGVRATPLLSVRIEVFSNQKVCRQDLNPEDWREIWPEKAAGQPIAQSVA
jgi:hypothetical protein